MFGGYLMRRALEVAWLSAYRFAKSPPVFTGLDDVVFRKPVEVGSLVEYIGRVVYTADGFLRVAVEAHKLSLRTDEREFTNEFHFIFHVSAEKSGEAVPEVYPETYEEGMMYLEGRRRWLNVLGQHDTEDHI
jgi:acyl-coenzyme A thioesterase 9